MRHTCLGHVLMLHDSCAAASDPAAHDQPLHAATNRSTPNLSMQCGPHGVAVHRGRAGMVPISQPQ